MGRRFIKPKPVEYAGVSFKSTLEAAWAFHFDSLRIKWLYEPIRVNFKSIIASRMKSYTPDFMLPETQMMIEIKPTEPEQSEFFRAGVACEVLGPAIWFVCGEPGQHVVYGPHRYANGKYGFFVVSNDAMPF